MKVFHAHAWALLLVLIVSVAEVQPGLCTAMLLRVSFLFCPVILFPELLFSCNSFFLSLPALQ